MKKTYLRAPANVIDHEKLLAAVEDYNTLSGVPLLTNFVRCAEVIAEVFCKNVAVLTDEQADLLKNETIDTFNALTTPLHEGKEYDGVCIFPMEDAEIEEPVIPSEVLPVRDDVVKSPPTKQTDYTKLFQTPSAGVVVMAAVVEGISDASVVRKHLEDYGLKLSDSSLSMGIREAQKVLAYQAYLAQGNTPICGELRS